MIMRGMAICTLLAMQSTGLAWAQSPQTQNATSDQMSADRRTSADTRIPVGMPDDTEVLGAEKTGASSGPPLVSLEQPIDPATYICGAGDVFELNFWGQQNFRLRLAADLEGRAFISKVGYVPVAGRSLADVREIIRKKVRGTYPGLQFDLTLVAPRSFIVHVVSNVKTPGTYTSNPLERISSLVSRAGNAGGSRRRVVVRRRNGKEVIADLTMYELTGNTVYNPFLLDGDVVTVPPAEFQVSISGAVNRPGTYELVKDKDLAELLELAGGFTTSVSRSLPIHVIRRNERQQEVSKNVAMPEQGLPPSEPLNADDTVIIPSSADMQRSVLLIGAVAGASQLDAVATSRRLPFIEGDTVRSLIDRAGGIRAPGDLSRSYISRPNPGKPPTLIPVDLEALLVRRDFSADAEVHMGDTIVIPPMQYSVFVEGAVGRPGLYDYNPVFGISEYIAHAGGRTRTARALDDAQLIDANGRTHAFSSALKPSPGDAILVPERNFSRPEIAQIVIAGAGLLLSGVAIAIAVTH